MDCSADQYTMNMLFSALLGPSVGSLSHLEDLSSRCRYSCLTWSKSASHSSVHLSLIVHGAMSHGPCVLFGKCVRHRPGTVSCEVSHNPLSPPLACLYSSVVERQSCKLEVRSSILREGITFFRSLDSILRRHFTRTRTNTYGSCRPLHSLHIDRRTQSTLEG